MQAAGRGADFLGRYRAARAMLQHMEQGCQPRGVLRRLGRDITYTAKCASRAQLALDSTTSPRTIQDH